MHFTIKRTATTAESVDSFYVYAEDENWNQFLAGLLVGIN